MERASRRGGGDAHPCNAPARDTAAPERRSRAQDGEEEDEARARVQCGLWAWRPACLQPLASKKAFLAVQGLVGLFIMALNAYFIGTISTIEKRFQLPSSTLGVVASAWDAGYMSSLLTLGYVGSRGHRPRFVAAGALLVGACCFAFAAPQALFQDARRVAYELGGGGAARGRGSLDADAALPLCGGAAGEECPSPEGGSFVSGAVLVFVGANFAMGAGGALYFSLSIAYLDDNTRRNKAPVMLGLAQVIRLMGSTTGFAMASFALTRYVDPSVTPSISNKDPQWIGAWWMGYVVFGAALCLLAPLMAAFPRELPRTAHRRSAARSHAGAAAPPSRSWLDFWSCVSRLLRNPVYMCNTFSTLFFVFGFSGHWNFMPKYMETLFRQTASRASFLTGSVALAFSAIGVLASALVIARFRPRARTLAAWNAVAEVLDVLGYGSWAFLGCPAERLHGAPAAHGGWNLTAPCNADCSCGAGLKFAPVCSAETFTTFFSPCHAGCSRAEVANGTTVFSNCTCISESAAVNGACVVDCSTNFTIFLVIQGLLRFFQATGKAGNMLIQFRSVNESDKSMSVAFTEFLMCLFVYIPAPIVYGRILDSVCLVWGGTCGRSGNCWLYDGHLLRYVLNFTAAGCLSCGLILDIGVWYFVKDLQIYDAISETDDEENQRNEISEKTNMSLDYVPESPRYQPPR